MKKARPPMYKVVNPANGKFMILTHEVLEQVKIDAGKRASQLQIHVLHEPENSRRHHNEGGN